MGMFRKTSPEEQAAKREEKAAREQERAAKYAEKQAEKVARKKAQQEAMEAAWETMRQENLELLTGMLGPNERAEGVFHTADPLMKKTLLCTSQRLLVAVIGGKQVETIPYSSIRSVRMGTGYRLGTSIFSCRRATNNDTSSMSLARRLKEAEPSRSSALVRSRSRALKE
jgi:hypothetical protein